MAQLARLGPDNLVVADTVLRDAPNAPGNGSNGSIGTCPTPTATRCSPSAATSRRRHSPRRGWRRARLDFATLADESTDVMCHFVLLSRSPLRLHEPVRREHPGLPAVVFLDDFTKFLKILTDDGRSLIERAFRRGGPARALRLSLRHANGSISRRRDADPIVRRRPSGSGSRGHRTSQAATKPQGASRCVIR